MEVEAWHVPVFPVSLEPKGAVLWFSGWSQEEEGEGLAPLLENLLSACFLFPGLSFQKLTWSTEGEGRRWPSDILPSSILFSYSSCPDSDSNILLGKEYMLFVSYFKGTAKILSLILLCWCWSLALNSERRSRSDCLTELISMEARNHGFGMTSASFPFLLHSLEESVVHSPGDGFSSRLRYLWQRGAHFFTWQPAALRNLNPHPQRQPLASFLCFAIGWTEAEASACFLYFGPFGL